MRHFIIPSLLFLLSVSSAKRPQLINLSNLLGTRTSIPAYERIISQPVFQVTTAWGSPYMLFEKYKDEEKALELEGGNGGKGGGEDDMSKFSRVQQKDDMQDTRPISLYFCDEHDARALADEMKQMKHMKESDLRITCTSLGKAVRQASNLGNGLPTGQPVEDTTGKLPGMDDGGSLRHKIVPSKREIFYAARCVGRERVGHFGNTAKEDADLLLQPQDVIEANRMGSRRKASKNAANRMRKARQLESEGLEESEGDRLRREYAHMEGQVGLPVFHTPGLTKRPPVLRRMIQGSKAWDASSLTPLYFSYEDLMKDWSEMRSNSPNKDKIPETPPQVEVFNMMDVVTSIDKDQWKSQRRSELVRERKGVWGKIPVVHNFVKGGISASAKGSGLEKVVFVPSSLGIQAKERISAQGSRKARLRPMRAWGKNA
mmetsp:Transcript_31347/g.66728  ORF Transcript_31347/g.66728 Transcript_31347/m.66728 type:complete len:430 (-) Transcript_31347:232-1521(-)|eukprot:CAMPEP_0172551376 /NCGR_PEP_ID=MMETSP1067-20121228/38828_1 /TAXON_ID=265564 ORGANISM="Thalassiosira punctigera, Strain Tpunct2005C2" /NCGR_SAMPLE_ID=MMETSP1067 /ASSEMBLY_ACC=CAM_ASM_000444 /LENGTH=429 /DNA_ID=CAMNT_0013339159 /DNA_START=170 /DNA_END=1459 /DNA_ORIENTATION=+